MVRVPLQRVLTSAGVLIILVVQVFLGKPSKHTIDVDHSGTTVHVDCIFTK